MNAVQTSIQFTNLSEIQILYRNKVKPADMPKVSCSQDAYNYFIGAWSPQLQRLEEFWILCLNRANNVLGYSQISSGGLSGTVADPKIIFQVALKANASSVILAHNHPSGNTQPSTNDIELTRKLKKAGEYLELKVLDHLIVTPESYFSFADESLL
jgi:DNA repair protein RadC